MKLRVVAAAIVLALVIACFFAWMYLHGANSLESTEDNQTASDQPRLEITKLVGGLANPWGLAFLNDGEVIFTEREGVLSMIRDGKKSVIAEMNAVRAVGEGGLMGVAVDPDYTDNQTVYVCFNRSESEAIVQRLTLSNDGTNLNDSETIVDGIPASASGRHSGCQLGFGPDRNLWIGTGDSANESTPQSQNSLGGKILRVSRNGEAVSSNPDGPDRRIYSYGHRNTQGLAFFESEQDDSFGVSVEHGSNVDDEVNALKPGNFGWAPGPGYDESVPMTDTERFPEAIEALWSSGDSTIATSGATFLRGERWQNWDGWLAIGVQREQHIRLLEFSGSKRGEGELKLYDGDYGRIRAVATGRDGSLYFSTDNGSDDAIYRIVPR